MPPDRNAPAFSNHTYFWVRSQKLIERVAVSQEGLKRLLLLHCPCFLVLQGLSSGLSSQETDLPRVSDIDWMHSQVSQVTDMVPAVVAEGRSATNSPDDFS